ncbi:efflux RND transporter periplasmic adaptor subunit [soil metagenome]
MSATQPHPDRLEPVTQDTPDDLGFELPEAGSGSKLGIIVVLAVLVVGGFAFRYVRNTSAHAESASPHSDAIAKVDVVKPTTLTSSSAIALPGIAKALEETKIYPRTTGYVRRWLVDIGDKVKEGQLLAEIDTPDLDAQLAQARAQLASAKASVRQAQAQSVYTKQNTARYQNLADQKLVSGSQLEQTQAQASSDAATVVASEANVAAAEANVRRLADLQSFSKVTAPFAGTITSRTIDRGALLTDTGTTPMFTLVAVDPIRVFIDVPQTVVPGIQYGSPATITVREFAGKNFVGTITRSAGALDPELHTMSTEVDVPNPENLLLPGMYVQAALTLPVPHKVIEIPATALYSDAQGLRVGVVDAQNKVKFVPITIERDTGATLWVATGLTGDEKLIKVAVASFVEGDPVEVNPAPLPAAGSGSATDKK